VKICFEEQDVLSKWIGGFSWSFRECGIYNFFSAADFLLAGFPKKHDIQIMERWRLG
jgi:hypothetical protein